MPRGSKTVEMAKFGIQQLWKSTKGPTKNRQQTSGPSSCGLVSATGAGSGNDCRYDDGVAEDGRDEDDITEFFFRTIAPHQAKQDNELTLAVGDLVTSVKDIGNGWLFGRKVGDAENNSDGVDTSRGGEQGTSSGIFPSACVRPLLRNFGPFGSTQLIDDEYHISISGRPESFRQCGGSVVVNDEEEDEVEETRRKLIAVNSSTFDDDETENCKTEIRSQRRQRRRRGFRFHGDSKDAAYDIEGNIELLKTNMGHQSREAATGSIMSLPRTPRADQQPPQRHTSTTGTGSGGQRLTLQRRTSSSSNGSLLGGLSSSTARCADCGTEVNDVSLFVEPPYGFTTAGPEVTCAMSGHKSIRNCTETSKVCVDNVGRQGGGVGTAEVDGKPRMVVKPNRDCSSTPINYLGKSAMMSADQELCYCTTTGGHGGSTGSVPVTLSRSFPHHPARPIDLNLTPNTTANTATTPRTGTGNDNRPPAVVNGGADCYRSVSLSGRSPLPRGTNSVNESQPIHCPPEAVSMTGTGNSSSGTSSRTTGIGFPYRTATVGDVRATKTSMIGGAYYTVDRRMAPPSQTTVGPPRTDVTVVSRTPRQLDNDDTLCIRCVTGNDVIDYAGCRCPDVATADNNVDDCGRGSCDYCRRVAGSRSASFGVGRDRVPVPGHVRRPGSSFAATCGGVNGVFFDLDGSAAGVSADPFDAERRTNERSAVTGSGGLLCRLVASVFIGQLIGVVMFTWMFCHLDYGLTVSATIGSTSAVVVCLLSAASRACRAVGALTLPSLATGEGRLAFVIIAVGALLSGPVSNVYVNMEEVSRAMGCSAEQSYNQTMFLLQPFDAMMTQLNWTIGGLQDAATNIGRGLKPLEDGLGTVEMYLDNGKLQLYGTRKTCKNLVDTAFNACATGIHKAQDQCLNVMGALGTVYHHARDVLDRINPDRWSPKQQMLHSQQQNLPMKKRQVILGDGSVMDELDLAATDRDICEPLDTVSVCQSLNDSETLCLPSRWAGEAIQEAINATQSAMSDLRAALRFYVSSEPYRDARVNASRLAFQIRRRVQDEFARRTGRFHDVVSVLRKLVPVALLLMIHASYSHLTRYIASDRYDNVYVCRRYFRAMDERRSEVATATGCCFRPVLPLRRHELSDLVDADGASLMRSGSGSGSALGPYAYETRMYQSGLPVVIVHLSLTVVCCTFDCVLYWLLSLVERHGRPGIDATGSDSLELVVAGDGVIVELLDIFLKGFHPGRWFSFSGDGHGCLPVPRPPSAANLAGLVILHVVLFVAVVFRARLLRLRDRIVGYFYPDRRCSRLARLYAGIVARRTRLPYLLYPIARARYRERLLADRMNPFRRLAAWPPIAAFSAAICRCRRRFRGGGPTCGGRWTECLVCEVRTDNSNGLGGRKSSNPAATSSLRAIACVDEGCRAVYCRECFDDLGRTCPLCQRQWQQRFGIDGGLQPSLPGSIGGCELSNAGVGCCDDVPEMDDTDDVVGSAAVNDDELMPYCKSGGKISV